MKFKAWATRQANGDYMLTSFPPTISPVQGTSHQDAYVVPGDGLGVRGLCHEWFGRVFNPDDELGLLQTRRVQVTIEVEE